MGRWIREFREWDPSIYRKYGIKPEDLGQSSSPKLESGEKLYMMVGDFLDDERNDSRADHWIMNDGYISIVPDNLDSTDYEEVERLEKTGFDIDF